MRLHYPAVLALAGLVAACSADTGEQGMAEDAAEMMTPEAAIEQIRADYVTHYNLHHADMVAALYEDSAVFLGADGTIAEGREVIQANLTEDMAGSPTLTLTSAETKVIGDHALSRGTFSVTVTPEGGAAVTTAGNYMTFFTHGADGWKISGVLSNYSAPPPEGFEYAVPMMEEPPENGTSPLAGQWSTHFNLGHADMVADLYADNAVFSPDGQAPLEGKEAIRAYLTASMAEGSPKITVHDVATMDLGDGYLLDGGWYQTTSSMGNRSGTYMVLTQQGADGTPKIVWHFGNSRPAPAGG